jgi:hypothetical protein
MNKIDSAEWQSQKGLKDRKPGLAASFSGLA